MNTALVEKSVHISTDGLSLEGILSIPPEAKGIVVFAHGSGSSRLSPRNTFVAGQLQNNGIASLLIDLLSAQEDEEYATRFDINLLTSRLIGITQWLQKNADTKHLSLCLFGASTGAAAALQAAARLGKSVRAVVSRGGRPDLAADVLDKVQSPTLLIVGGDDYGVIELNQRAYAKIRCEKKLEIVKGATHLFEEPGTLEEVALLAARWFKKYL